MKENKDGGMKKTGAGFSGRRNNDGSVPLKGDESLPAKGVTNAGEQNKGGNNAPANRPVNQERISPERISPEKLSPEKLSNEENKSPDDLE